MALHWRNPSSGTTRNDLTFTCRGTGRLLLINTVHPLSDGRTPPRREREVAKRTVHHAAPGDIVAVIPLPLEGGHVGEERMETLLTPILAELELPFVGGDPRDSIPLDRLWRLLPRAG